MKATQGFISNTKCFDIIWLRRCLSYPTTNVSFYLEGDHPIQVDHSVGHLYVGSLGGSLGWVVTPVGHGENFEL